MSVTGKAGELSASNDSPLPKTANFLNQLEAMMGVVKREAGALESMKQRLKEMEELKLRCQEYRARVQTLEVENADVQRRLRETELQNVDMRTDMQRLNDIYSKDREKLAEMQQSQVQLEQRLNSLSMEKDFFFKESQRVPEFKSALKAAKVQLQQLKTQVEEERTALQVASREYERRLSQAESDTQHLKQHITHLTEEIKSHKSQSRAQQEQLATGSKKYMALVQASLQASDRAQMQQEDLVARLRSLAAALLQYRQRDADKLTRDQSSIHELRQSWKLKDDELQNAQRQLSSLEVLHSETINALAQAQEQLSQLNRSNSALHAEVESLRAELDSRRGDEGSWRKDLELMQSRYVSLEALHQQREADHQQEMRVMLSQRDELQRALATQQMQCDALQQQSKQEQTRHWEEMRRQQEQETTLADEVERLHGELQEKMLRIHALETEKLTAESVLKSEALGTNNILQTLRGELEKRLDELVSVRQERDALAQQTQQMHEKLMHADAELQRQERVFKQTIEQDREQMKTELLSRTRRINQLENEKKELLNETMELMNQVAEAQKTLAAKKRSADEAQSSVQQRQDQLLHVQRQLQEAQAELRRAQSAEQLIRDQLQQQELKHAAEQQHFQLQLQESKKGSGAQVVELSKQVQMFSADLDGLKQQLAESQEKAAKLAGERDKLRTEHNQLLSKHLELQENFNGEVSGLRQELQELRNKLKQHYEQKTKLEMEIMNMSVECQQLRHDLQKKHEQIRHYESNESYSHENVRQLQQNLQSLQESRQLQQQRLQELENQVQGKNQSIEQLKMQMTQLERDQLMEIRKLRLALASGEQETADLRDANAKLAKETQELRSAGTRLQTQHQQELQQMLEEIKSKEELLAKEKKARKAEAEDWKARNRELELQLDHSKSAVEEMQLRVRNERQERDLKQQQSEKEMERLLALLGEKDAQIDDMEQNQHNHRQQLLQLREQVNRSDAEMQQLKVTLEIETENKKRLESRLRTLLSHSQETDSTPFLQRSSASAPGSQSTAGDLRETTANESNLVSMPNVRVIDTEHGREWRGKEAPMPLSTRPPTTYEEPQISTPNRRLSLPGLNLSTPQPSTQVMDRVSAALTLKLAQQQRVGAIQALTPIRSQDEQPATQATATELSPRDPIEESIRRAQLAINRKLGANADTQIKRSASEKAVGSDPAHPSGKNASKLLESIQQGHALYSSSPRPFEDEIINTPQPQPAVPPSFDQVEENDDAEEQDVPITSTAIDAPVRIKKKKKRTMKKSEQLPSGTTTFPRIASAFKGPSR